MSLVNENVFNAVSEDEAMRTQVSWLAARTALCLLVTCEWQYSTIYCYRESIVELHTIYLSLPPSITVFALSCCLLKGARIHDHRGDCATCACPMGISK